MIRLLVSFTLIALLAACGNAVNERTNGYGQADNPVDSLFQEVMDGHDAAMAKMGKLKGARKQIEARLDSLEKAGIRPELQEGYRTLKEKLLAAENEMNVWMEEFSIDSAEDDLKRRLEYLKKEKIKVDNVKEDIFGALHDADSALDKP